jgi:ABC-type sugar transport system substrate-binding protein
MKPGSISSNLSAKLTFVVSLITQESDYQREQAYSAQQAANRLNVEVQILYADSDPIRQSQQLLEVVQNRSSGVKALIFEPAGSTAFPQVARAAAAAGLGWVVMNRNDPSVAQLRSRYSSPIFTASEDHEETGRILGRQITALLPRGGAVLCLQGPSGNPVTERRMAGMHETKPNNIELKFLRSAQWTEEAGYKAVASWLRLSTSYNSDIAGVIGQSDLIALGAHRAFQELTTGERRNHWLEVPFLGVNGLKAGQDAVHSGVLAATVVIPPCSAAAVETLVHAYREGVRPQECILVTPRSFPDLATLVPRGGKPRKGNGDAGRSRTSG